MVEQALERERDQRRADILSVLTPLVIEIKTTKPYGEMMILNAACFIAGEREAEFDRAVHALAERFGELITWRYTGTLPPFNFVNVIINAADL